MKMRYGWMGIVLCVFVIVVGSVRAAEYISLPPSVHADTEIATNVACHAWTARQKRFVFTLTFDVTPSNNVQAAFGADAGRNGALDPDEERLVFGWDCGAWFLRVGGVVSRCLDPPCETDRIRVLRYAATCHPDGRTREVDLSMNGRVLFPYAITNRPDAFFDADWSIFRVTARGTDDHDACFRVKNIPDGYSLILR